MTSIDLFAWSLVVSSWILGDWDNWRWRSLALLSFDWAIAASFDFLSKSLMDFWGRLIGFCFRLRCCGFVVLGPGLSNWCEDLVAMGIGVRLCCTCVRVFPIGVSAVIVWLASFLLTEIVLFFLGFYYILVRSYMLRNALISVWFRLRLPNHFFWLMCFFWCLCLVLLLWESSWWYYRLV